MNSSIFDLKTSIGVVSVLIFSVDLALDFNHIERNQRLALISSSPESIVAFLFGMAVLTFLATKIEILLKSKVLTLSAEQMQLYFQLQFLLLIGLFIIDHLRST